MSRNPEAGPAPSHRQDYLALPASRTGGTIEVPGDKSISHRALMLGAIAEGETRVRGFLESEDCIATRRALEALGVRVDDEPDGTLRIAGVGPHGLKGASGPIDLGNSGTAIRLMTGLLAAQPFDSTLTGDASLRQRPMERVAAPLRTMGARIATRDGKAPIEISGGARLVGIDYAQPVASAQVKSALLLAALYASGTTVVRSPGPSRDHTERMLRSMGATLRSEDGLTVGLTGPQRLTGGEIDVPGDLSSAAFFIVAACLAATDGLLIRNVGVNPTRDGILTILEAMGARIEVRNSRMAGSEPVADLFVRRSELKGIDVPPELVPLAIDEFPILFVAAAGARGPTTVLGAEELRHKESDRLAVMAQGLAALGAKVEEREAGLVIEGGRRLQGGVVASHGDHRIAMSFAVASLLSDGPIEIHDTAAVATSFPTFLEVAAASGLAVSKVS